MWGADKHRKADISQFSGKTTIIAQDAEIRGDLTFNGAVQIDGRVVGNIEAEEGLVRVSEHGYVEGIIKAPSVLVNGQVVGDVHAFEHLELDTKARINGDLHYRFLEMVMGAQISGQLHYLGGGEMLTSPLPLTQVTEE
ncbi:MAG TPA: polymer-forming cytoskeletal family protein [Pseudomonas xinjiangensis]|uniref:Polymer-forming cytoskeletal family protein n=2 Tax=root TaxID=1 RepID=A0A7V1FSX7_9GAMM|nr:polymer-forming cytoskeletal family protein [Halopseudomonas xinjiangensis]HEC48851.1 polymer-forming cytoskeletal family protein [Halopseudomonas xinjiangensis]